jgi:membrane-associated PAP2 superfamily phosphatase
MAPSRGRTNPVNVFFPQRATERSEFTDESALPAPSYLPEYKERVTEPEDRKLTAAADRTLGLAIALLIGVIALFELTPLDLLIQDQLFDFESSRWIVDDDWLIPRAIFHEFPTILSIAVGLALTHLLMRPERWRKLLGRNLPRRRQVLCALLTVVTVPAVVAVSKATTNVFCPSEIDRYGGDVCYTRLFEKQPDTLQPERRGQCFPGGHASGPFAMVGLFGLARRRQGKIAALTFALIFGWIAGGYQMLTGAHYISHTLVSMIVAWIGFLLWRRALRLRALGV